MTLHRSGRQVPPSAPGLLRRNVVASHNVRSSFHAAGALGERAAQHNAIWHAGLERDAIHAGLGELPCALLELALGRDAHARARRPVARIDEDPLTGLRVLHVHQPASGRWRSRGSSMVIATTSWRAASCASGTSQPSARKSDRTATIAWCFGSFAA